MRFGVKPRVRWNPRRLLSKAKTGSQKAVSLAARDVWQESRKLIKRKGYGAQVRRGKRKGRYYRKRYQQRLEAEERKPSPAGTAPYTWKRGGLRDAIAYAVEKKDFGDAVIGPRREVISTIGAVHEHGRWHLGHKYPKRPFMGPGLRKAKPKLPKRWRNSIR